MSDDNLTQMPDPYLDGITDEDVAREIRGAVYKAREMLDRALDAGDGAGIYHARSALADLLKRAAEEGVKL